MCRVVSRLALCSFFWVLCFAAPLGWSIVPLGGTQGRVEVGAHNGIIREFAYDARRRIVISASDDKTLRVWDADDGYLYRTYRVPISSGHVGQLFSVDLAQARGLIAAGGWTPNSQAKAFAVYFLDLDTGEIVQILDGLPDVISTLRFSPDEESICVAFGSQSPGLRCLSYPGLQLLFEDMSYRHMVRRLQWSEEGELIAAAADGRVTRYSDQGEILVTTTLTGTQPASSALSPNGSLLAIGMLNAPLVKVLDALTLEEVYSLQPPDNAQRNLPAVTWGNEGDLLYAAGDNNEYRSPVFVWSSKGDLADTIELESELRVTWFESRGDGGLLVATEDPALIRLDVSGRQVFRSKAAIHDFSDQRKHLLIDPTGNVVAFSGFSGPAVILDEQSVYSGYQNPDVLTPARHSAADIKLESWKNSLTPTLDGAPLLKHPGELVRALSIAPDQRSFVLGAEWSITRYSSSGRVIWRNELANIAWHVNVSQSGHVVVAALSDGSFRWYDFRGGQELLAAYRNPDDREWIIWTPDGYYASSPSGDNYLGWHVNQQLDEATFRGAVQYERIFYRPDLVAERISRGLAGEGHSSPQVAPIVLASIPVPKISLARPPWETRGLSVSTHTIDVLNDVDHYQPKEINVFVNDLPVVPFRERAKLGSKRTIEVDIPLTEKVNHVRVEAFSEQAIGVTHSRITLENTPPPHEGERTLYLVSVGASTFENLPGSMQLQFSANDAVAIENLFQSEFRSRFDLVKTYALTDLSWDMPTKNNIESALRFLRDSGPNDTVAVFLASHGLSNSRGDYYFVPRDADLSDIQRVYENPDEVSTLIHWSQFVDALRTASGRRYLIVDTCHAEQIGGRLDLMPLAKRSAASSFGLIAAAADGQESQEMPSVRHGVFTYGLISAFKRALKTADNASMEVVFQNAADFVATKRPNMDKSQEPQFTAPGSLRRYNWQIPVQTGHRLELLSTESEGG